MNPIPKILVLLSITALFKYVPLFGNGKVSDTGEGGRLTIRSIYTEKDVATADNHPA